MTLKGSRTEKNLLAAFAGESQARNRYTYFASQAAKDGLMQIASIFEETANQETGARQALLPASSKGERSRSRPPSRREGSATTAENLAAAAGGEHLRVDDALPRVRARSRARKGSRRWPSSSRPICVAEKQHEKRYLGPPGERQGRDGLQEDEAGRVALPQLRLPPHRDPRRRAPARRAPTRGPTSSSSGKTGRAIML